MQHVDAYKERAVVYLDGDRAINASLHVVYCRDVRLVGSAALEALGVYSVYYSHGHSYSCANISYAVLCGHWHGGLDSGCQYVSSLNPVQ